MKLPCLTLYAFSRENWSRPQAEVEFLMRLLREYLKRELPTIHKNNIRLTVIGRGAGLPEGVRKDLDHAMQLTSGNTGMNLVVALNYGARAELVDAFNAMLEQARRNGESEYRADEETVASHLYTAGLPDPDLLIRTSGEMRVSNFLLWQIAYAEIYVTETLWPDFSRARLIEALLDYQKRERRYGGLGPAPAPIGAPERVQRGKRLVRAGQGLAPNAATHPHGCRPDSDRRGARLVGALPGCWRGWRRLVAILALVGIFRSRRTGGDAARFASGPTVCAAGIFYAQYSQGLVETHTFSAGYSIVRDAAGGVVSLDAVLLVFVFGAAGIGLATRWALS